MGNIFAVVQISGLGVEDIPETGHTMFGASSFEVVVW